MCQIIGKASYTKNLEQEPVNTQDPVASQLIAQETKIVEQHPLESNRRPRDRVGTNKLNPLKIK